MALQKGRKYNKRITLQTITYRDFLGIVPRCQVQIQKRERDLSTYHYESKSGRYWKVHHRNW